MNSVQQGDISWILFAETRHMVLLTGSGGGSQLRKGVLSRQDAVQDLESNQEAQPLQKLIKSIFIKDRESKKAAGWEVKHAGQEILQKKIELLKKARAFCTE